MSLIRYDWSTTYIWGAFYPAGSLIVGYVLQHYLGNINILLANDCNTYEFFPSISSLIAQNPSKQIWQIAIVYMMCQRLPDGIYKYSYFKRLILLIQGLNKNNYSMNLFVYNSLNFIIMVIFHLEYLFLLLLTYVTSNDSLFYHVVGFEGFMAFSIIHVLLSNILQYHLLRNYNNAYEGYWYKNLFGIHPILPANKNLERLAASVKLRTRLFVLYIAVFSTCIYFYFLSQSTCCAGCYSCFAILEWTTVAINIYTHATYSSEMSEYEVQLAILNEHI